MIKNNQKYAVYARYLSVGILNTIVTGVTISFLSLTAFSAYFNNFAGFSLGIVTSFFLNGKWTFNQTQLLPSTFVPFLCAVVISYGANLLVMTVSREFFSILIAQLLGILTYSIIFFAINRAYVFNR